MTDHEHAGSHTSSTPRRSGRRAVARAGRLARVGVAACAVALTSALLAGSALGASQLTWSSQQTLPGEHPRAISCPSESLCVIVDGSGNVLASTNPLSATPGWSVVFSSGGSAFTGVSCASPALCVAVDSTGHAFASSSPASGSWSLDANLSKALTGVSCPTNSMCAVAEEAGSVVGLLAGGWPAAEIDPGGDLQSVSCANALSCVAVDASGNAFGSESPPGGVAAWHRRGIDPGQALNAASCVPSGACVSVDGVGNALASGDPGRPGATWSSTPVTNVRLQAVSCDAAGLCVAGDENGIAWASDGVASALPNWGFSGTGIGSLTGISCLPAGACLAIDNAGRVAQGRVPAPEAFTAPPLQAGETSATLLATVIPNDAQLGACVFEYGEGPRYGQSVPCSSAPVPAGGAQAVTAQVGGLAPNTLYHYRVVVSSLGGVRASADQTFGTAVNSLIAIVQPHPAIHGTPAVGSRLSCSSGTPSGAAQLTFAWLRDLVPIPRATSSTYTVAGADSSHHLQCQVTASDAGGTATARSAFVTVPVQGVVAAAGETVIGGARYRKGALRVPVLCSAHASSGCRIAIHLSTTAGKPLTLAAARVRLGRGQHRTVAVGLSSTGKRLLRAHRRLVAQLTVSGTVIGVIEALLSRQRVTL
ncbi:MAG TPA: hypothetical protein VGX51_01355 [Solirubrobacteraceae bacterium]|jgi:hypothetical protein|nr:hypothetical protein [Solirubrobacteraceae bacterium]